MAHSGNKNETGTTLDALKRMWIGVVHPLHPHSRRCFCRRPYRSDGCRCRRVSYYAADAPCSHPALAAFLYFRTDKNKMNDSMFLHADEGIRIVDRYIITVKLQIRVSGANIWRARGRIRAPIWAHSRACFQCSGLENRRKGVAMWHGSRRVDVRARAEVRLFHWQIV